MNYYYKAQQLYQKDQWGAARIILQNGILKSDAEPRVYHLLGLVLYHQGYFKAAVKQLKKAAALQKNPEYFLNLSIVLNELGFYKEGKEAYYQATKLQQQSVEQNWKVHIADQHLNLAQAYLDKKYFKPALRSYTQALQFKPQDPKVYMGLANTLWQMGQKEEGWKVLKYFIQIEPTFIAARLLSAEWYFEIQQIPQAVNEWESVLYQDPKNEEATQALMNIQQIAPWS